MIEPLEPRTLLAAQLAADINPATVSSFPSQMAPFGNGQVLFFATETGAKYGGGLYRSDGTAAGTVLVHGFDTDLGLGGDAPMLTSVGNTAFFFARPNPATGQFLWRTDGTPAGTVEVMDLTSHYRSNAMLSTCNETVYVGVAGTGAGSPGGTPARLYRYDASSAAFALVREFQANVAPGPLVSYAGSCYFVATDGPAAGPKLWRTDGTPAGTTVITDTGPGAALTGIGTLTVANGLIYFPGVASDRNEGVEPWRSDGTAAGTFRLGDLKPGTAGSNPVNFTPLPGGGVAFTTQSDGKLYRTDGTAAGTTRITPPPLPALQLSFANRLTRAGDTVYFAGADSTGGLELWKTDGTERGTVRVKDIFAGASGSEPVALTALGNLLVFRVTWDPEGGSELWKSDGTAAGTVRLKDIRPGRPNSYPGGSDLARGIAVSGGTVFFSADDGPHGEELWRTDGTDGGTTLVKDVAAKPVGSNPDYGFNVDGKYLVTATGFESPRQWWSVDPAASAAAVSSSPMPSYRFGPVTHLDGDIIYFADDYSSPGLYRTDGTAAGTRWLAPADVAAVGGQAGYARLGDKLFFIESSGYFWATDGTPAGTAKVIPDAFSFGYGVAATSRYVYFSARHWPEAVDSLWRSDGTAAGTTRVLNGLAQHMFVLGDRLYYFGDANVNGHEVVSLFRLGDDANTPTLVRSFEDILMGFMVPIVVGDRVFFPGRAADTGTELWVSDGTTDGTHVVKDIAHGPNSSANSSEAQLITTLGDRVLFAAYDQRPAPEMFPDHALWITDGTEAGTVRLTPPGMFVNNRAYTDEPEKGESTVVGGKFYFAADDGVHGNEVWVTDGTPAGTHLAADVNPGPAGSDPAAMADVGGVLYFAATDPVAGREVWKIVQPDVPAAVNVAGRYLFYNNSTYDGQDDAPAAADDAAVATDKRPLLPGQAASFANVSSYSRGLNGIILDVTPGLALAAFRPGTGAVELKAGNGGDPSTWPDASYPSRYDIRPGAGAGGSDRVTFVWPDGAIENTWLRVKIRAMPQYGLMQDEVFTFGNLIGETGDDGRVNALDLGQVKLLLNTAAPIDSRVDFNRDGRVNALDLGIVKKYLNRTLAPTVLPPPLVPAAPAASPEQLSVRQVWDEPQWDLL